MANTDRLQIPCACPSCGALFASRAINIQSGIEITGLTLNVTEPCPFCGKPAQMAQGIFNVANGAMQIVRAPEVTHNMLAAFEAAVKSAIEKKTGADDLAKEVEAIHPEFAEAVRKASAGGVPRAVTLLLLLATIKSCNVEVKLDANQLIDQMRDKPPAAVFQRLKG